ncbi:MAG: pyruvate dehydrogenase [Sphingobacteriales bacterium]|nr:MAG: pyruvate dehydrogenase [Sphingobacteriales bacterium]TAF81700.1 MAG: pyruvate dehydrogenase [Sphingobacteriales bacterium]
MAEIIKMPKMSDTMTEGVLAKWHKKVGDKIKAGDVIAEIETDKATMDFESFQEGTLLFVGLEEGKAVPVDTIIAIIGNEGEDYKVALATEQSNNTAEATAEEDKTAPQKEAVTETIDTSNIPATVIRMPALSDTMTEGVINKWNFKVGDTVKSDDSLADVETDKATMEVVGYEDGTLLYLSVNEGEAVPVNGIIAIVGKAGTDISALLNQSTTAAKTEPIVNETKSAEAKPKTTEKLVSLDDSRVKASPLARKIAQDKGINLNDVKGSAEGGRIVKKDIDAYTPTVKKQPIETPSAASIQKTSTIVASLQQVTGQEKYTEVPVSQMRKVIAKRLAESLFTAPHFYLTMSIDMDQAITARGKINEYAPTKVSFNDMVLKACAVALKQHPNINSSWLGDKIRFNQHVNIGVAVAVEDGLLVPVVRFADGKSLTHISAEVKDFATKAKAKKLQPADWEGSTFTISNLGMFGIDEFTAIINPPDACILAVGGISQIPVVKNGQIVPGNVMKVTLSCDHRVVDGAMGAAFLQTLKALLEEPVRLLA